MQAKFYKTALTLDHTHSILMVNPEALCHVFFGGFIVALTTPDQNTRGITYNFGAFSLAF